MFQRYVQSTEHIHFYNNEEIINLCQFLNVSNMYSVKTANPPFERAAREKAGSAKNGLSVTSSGQFFSRCRLPS
jgi:hypothetical protein